MRFNWLRVFCGCHFYFLFRNPRRAIKNAQTKRKITANTNSQRLAPEVGIMKIRAGTNKKAASTIAIMIKSPAVVLRNGFIFFGFEHINLIGLVSGKE